MSVEVTAAQEVSGMQGSETNDMDELIFPAARGSLAKGVTVDEMFDYMMIKFLARYGISFGPNGALYVYNADAQVMTKISAIMKGEKENLSYENQ
jgi:hypothetical protein